MHMKGLLKNDQGSSTLEATLVFPIIMLGTFIFLLFAVAQWEQAALYQQATIIAEQVATTWDLSSKDLITGDFGPVDTDTDGRYKDGLYWRLFNDFQGHGLAQDKINKAEKYLIDKGVSGTITYDGLLTRKITVRLNRNLGFHLKFPGLPETVTASASAHVAEPVQFMRNIDMAVYYYQQLSEKKQLLESFEKK